MALRSPLVMVNGEIQQLQSGDDINATITGAIEYTVTNDNAGSIVIGAPVYATAADHVDKAKADASATSKVIGLVKSTSIATSATGQIAVSGILVATTTQWDAVAGTTGGLTYNTEYFLDPSTAGKITATAPTTAGQYVVSIGTAMSTTELRIGIHKRILL